MSNIVATITARRINLPQNMMDDIAKRLKIVLSHYWEVMKSQDLNNELINEIIDEVFSVNTRSPVREEKKSKPYIINNRNSNTSESSLDFNDSRVSNNHSDYPEETKVEKLSSTKRGSSFSLT